MLRLMGLPARARCPRATVRRAAGRIELRFAGADCHEGLDVDLALADRYEDPESVELQLLAQLDELGYLLVTVLAGAQPAESEEERAAADQLATFRESGFGDFLEMATRPHPDVMYFNEVDKGGHFAAWEEPDLFASEVGAAFRSLR